MDRETSRPATDADAEAESYGVQVGEVGSDRWDQWVQVMEKALKLRHRSSESAAARGPSQCQIRPTDRMQVPYSLRASLMSHGCVPGEGRRWLQKFVK